MERLGKKKPVYIRQAVLGGKSGWAYVAKAGDLTEDRRLAAVFYNALHAYDFVAKARITKFHIIPA